MIELHIIEIELERLYQKTLAGPLNNEDTKKFDTFTKLKVLLTTKVETNDEENPFDGQSAEVLKELFEKMNGSDEG